MVGVDGGGTKTGVVVVGLDGRVRGMGEGGSGNYHDVGAARVAQHVDAGFAEAKTRAGLPRTATARAAFLGLASVATEDDRAAIREVVEPLGLAPPDRVGIDQDLRIALAGGLGGAPGIVVIAGTGSSCFGRSGTGATWQAGGFGSVLDDVGSGYDLGRQALVAAVHAYDGRGPSAPWIDRVLTRLGVATARDLPKLVQAEGMTRAEVAALAPLVTAAAREGDDVARGIVDRGTDALARCVEVVARRIGDERPAVTLCGGLALSGPPYRDSFERAVARRLAGARLMDPLLPPERGAALLALESLGVAVTPPLLQALACDSYSTLTPRQNAM